MSYFVEYNPELKERYPVATKAERKLSVRPLVWGAVAIGALYIIASSGVLRCLIPGDPDVTTAAFSNLVNEIGDGEPVREAFVNFCKEIIFCGS